MSSVVLDHFNDHVLCVYTSHYPLQIIVKLQQHFQTFFLASNFSLRLQFFPPSFPLLSSPVPHTRTHTHSHTLPPVTQTGSVSWCLPYSLHMLSRRNGCLMICLHRSCRELFRFELRRRKGNERNVKKKKSAFCCHKSLYNTLTMDPCWYMKEHCASKNISSGGFWILTSTEH